MKTIILTILVVLFAIFGLLTMALLSDPEGRGVKYATRTALGALVVAIAAICVTVFVV